MFVLLVLATFGPELAVADGSMRCGTKIIRSGDLKAEVLAKCGPPDLRETVSGEDQVKIEIWTYLGSREGLTRVLRFREARLQRIEIEDTR